MPHARSPNKTFTCQQVTVLLVEYVAGEMDAAICLAFETHLRDCAACVAYLATYQKTIRVTQMVRYEALPLERLARL